MPDMDLVSVVIPSYNRAATVEKAIRSVLDQTWSNLELILVDDGSGDNTRQIVEVIGDPRLRYVYQENAGACAARNHGAELARGLYVAFHDSDDIWYPDKLEKQMAVMERTGADIVVCKLLMHQADGTIVRYPKRIGEGFLSSADDLFGIGTQTILARRKVTESIRFDASFPRYQDLEWIYRALQSYSVYCLDEALVDYTVGADSISANPKKMYQALQMFADKYPNLKKHYPALSMHIVRNLLGNWKDFKPVAEGEEKAYWQLIRRFYPGMFRYFVSRFSAAPRSTV